MTPEEIGEELSNAIGAFLHRCQAVILSPMDLSLEADALHPDDDSERLLIRLTMRLPLEDREAVVTRYLSPATLHQIEMGPYALAAVTLQNMTDAIKSKTGVPCSVHLLPLE